MIFVALAWAAPVPLPERRAPVVYGEVRLGHAIVQQPGSEPIPSFQHFSPDVHATGSMTVGGRHGGFELGAHAGVERARFPGEANTAARIEPRLGGRAVASFGGFVGAGIGLGVAFLSGGPGAPLRPWAAPAAFATAGWIGPGERIRPVFAVEVRVGPRVESYALCAVGGACSSRRFDPAGSGILGSAGVSFGGRPAR